VLEGAARSGAGRSRRLMNTAPLLSVTGLTKHFPVKRGIVFQSAVGTVRAVDGLSFALGHHRHGVLLLPITVDTVTAHLLGRPLPEVARPFLATHATP